MTGEQVVIVRRLDGLARRLDGIDIGVSSCLDILESVEFCLS